MLVLLLITLLSISATNDATDVTKQSAKVASVAMTECTMRKSRGVDLTALGRVVQLASEMAGEDAADRGGAGRPRVALRCPGTPLGSSADQLAWAVLDYVDGLKSPHCDDTTRSWPGLLCSSARVKLWAFTSVTCSIEVDHVR